MCKSHLTGRFDSSAHGRRWGALFRCTRRNPSNSFLFWYLYTTSDSFIGEKQRVNLFRSLLKISNNNQSELWNWIYTPWAAWVSFSDSAQYIDIIIMIKVAIFLVFLGSTMQPVQSKGSCIGSNKCMKQNTKEKCFKTVYGRETGIAFSCQ